MSRYKEMGYAWGVLFRVEEGWPVVQEKLRPRPIFYRPSNAILKIFHHLCKVIMESKGVFEGSYCDHDSEDFRRRLNFFYRLHRNWPIRDRFGIAVKRFGKRLFEAVVYYHYLMKNGVE